MGLLLKLLTFPVSGPVGGTVWIAEQLLAAAEEELEDDEGTIQQELMQLDDRYAAGELSEADYEEAADELLARLLAARGGAQGIAEGGDEEVP